MKFFKEKIKVGPVQSSKFDLGHERKQSMNMAQLVPILLQDVLPGDSIRVNSEIFLRFAPLLAPVMHRIKVYTHYFFVPNRLLWDQWEDFITGGEDGTQEPQFPTIRITEQQGVTPVAEQFGLGSLADYLGLGYTTPPVGLATNPIDISALPFRAYQLIYNDYYRDQNVMPKVPLQKTGGNLTLADTTNNTTYCADLLKLRNRAWEKDYFTTALPWPQRGASAFAPTQTPSNTIAKALRVDGGEAGPGPIAVEVGGNVLDAALQGIHFDQQGQVLIQELRKANRLQEWLERQARGGGRMFETILSQFGVKISDSRVQRPEYLGGGVAPVKISEVLSTFDNTAADRPQGDMTGHGIASHNFHGFNRSFEEHGYVIGIMSILPTSAYQNGVERHWLKKDKFDFAWPSFANLGEQEVKGLELYYDYNGVTGQGQETFGYQSRFAEYKFKQSSVHGDFRESLLYWHEGRDFTAPPLLNQSFIECTPEQLNRIFALTDNTHKIWCQIYNDVSAIRPLPYYGTPKF